MAALLAWPRAMQKKARLLAYELLAVLDEDALCVLAHTLACQVVNGSVRVVLSLNCHVADAVSTCAWSELIAVEAELALRVEQHVRLSLDSEVNLAHYRTVLSLDLEHVAVVDVNRLEWIETVCRNECVVLSIAFS